MHVYKLIKKVIIRQPFQITKEYVNIINFFIFIKVMIRDNNSHGNQYFQLFANVSTP